MASVDDILSMGIPGKRFGEILSDARRSARLSTRHAAQRAGITTALLGDYERGKAEPSVQHLRTLLEVYGIDAGDLVPRRELPAVDMVHRTVTVGSETRAVGDSRAAASAMLRHDQALHLFVELVRQARSAGSRAKFTLREADAVALAELLSLDESVVVSRLMEIMGCSERDATNLWRVMSRAPSIGLAAAILATSATVGFVALGGSNDDGPAPQPVEITAVVEDPADAVDTAGADPVDAQASTGASGAEQPDGESPLGSDVEGADGLVEVASAAVTLATPSSSAVEPGAGEATVAATPTADSPLASAESAESDATVAASPAPVGLSGTAGLGAAPIPEIATDEVVDYPPQGI